MEELLSVRGLERRYAERTALRGFDLRISRGEVLGLLGPNGAGKTTCLQILSGNLLPSAGEIRICGLDLGRRPRRAKRRLGYLPERPPLYPEMRVDEYRAYSARLRRIPRRRIGQALEEAKTWCGLAGVGTQLIGRLSKGYRQRVGIAQAIIHQPDLVILDEPTDGLDPVQIREVRDLVRTLAASSGVIFSSHILPEVQAMCTRVMILRDGRVLHEAHLARQPNVHSPGRYRVRLNPASPLTSLTGIPGVASAEALPDDAFRVTLGPGEPADALARRLVEQGLGLIELTPDRDDLEQVFFDILNGEQAA
ncbi:MAG: ATP-binding cassette domain-containing protein [Chromatiaceae bacterium]